jgi:hypothetical protein
MCFKVANGQEIQRWQKLVEERLNWNKIKFKSQFDQNWKN